MSEKSKPEELKEENQNAREKSNRQLKQEHYKNIIQYIKSKIQLQIQEINLRQKRRSPLKFKSIPKTMKKNQNINLKVHILPKISSKFFN